ncbi:MAG: hypothetical protein A2033_00760 [Bacteroidetes bacterium GWA2_31_9]|nr:MAG: hypothetical protein A2033_00760 [Bacteroidetes bacterium GWA2_31_9]
MNENNDSSSEATIIIKDKVAIPNSTGVLVMGIISIASCFCYGVPGLVLGIISLSLAGKGKRLYNTNPEFYTEASFKNLKAGQICAIIGTILSGLMILIIIVYVFILGFAISSAFDGGRWY